MPKLIKNLNQQKGFVLFQTLLEFKRLDRVIILKIFSKLIKILKKKKFFIPNLRYLKSPSFIKPSIFSVNFFVRKVHKVELDSIRNLTIFNNLIDLYNRLFFDSPWVGWNLVFNIRIFSIKIIFKQFEFYKKNYSLKLILENKFKLKFGCRHYCKQILFDNKNILFKTKFKIFKKTNEALFFKNDFCFQNFIGNIKDNLIFKSLKYFHCIDHKCFIILKSFSSKVGKTSKLFLKFNFRDTNSSMCQFYTISSKIWTFYHEVVAIVIKQTPKPKFLENRLNNLVENYETFEKNLICINNILYIKLDHHEKDF